MDEDPQAKEAFEILVTLRPEFEGREQLWQLAGQIISNQQVQHMQGAGKPLAKRDDVGSSPDVGKQLAEVVIARVKKKGATPEKFELPAFKAVSEYEQCLQATQRQKLCLAALIISLGRLLIPFANLKLPSSKD